MRSREFNNNIEKIRPKLICFANSFIGKGAATAEDMVQDAIIKVWSEVEKKNNIRNLEALTIVVLRNLCLDYLRLKKNSVEKVEISALRGSEQGFASRSSDPHGALESKEQRANIGRCLEMLPDDQQLAIRLRDILGYEFHEIATILDTGEGNVRTILSRGRKRIRELLTETN